MTTTHELVTWTAGDDWQIDATLLREDGSAYDLSGPHTIEWALMDGSFMRVLDQNDVVIVVTNATAGQCSIKISASSSSPLAGTYTDVIRIIFASITSTLSYGQITVKADPWRGPHALTQQGRVNTSPVLRLRTGNIRALDPVAYARAAPSPDALGSPVVRPSGPPIRVVPAHKQTG